MALYRYIGEDTQVYTPAGRPPVIATNGTVIDWDEAPDARWVLEPVASATKEKS